MSRHHPASRRTPNKSDDADDLFVANMLQFSNWAGKHRQALVVIGLVAAGALVLGYQWKNAQSRLVNDATEQLVQIQQLRVLGDPERAKTELGTYLVQFGGTTAGDEARLLLGQLNLETGDAAAAVAALEPLSGARTPMGMQATYLLAGAHEEAGSADEAERLYLTVANRADMSFLVRDALSQAARIRTDKQDFAGAAQLYQELLTYFEDNDPRRGLVEMRLAEAETGSRG